MTAGVPISVEQERRSGAALVGAWVLKRAGPTIVFIVLILVWEYAVRILGVKTYLLPPPSLIWTEFLRRWDVVLAGSWVTIQEIVGGYLLAIAVSIPLALVVARSRFVEESIYPVVVFLQIIPKIAIAPLFIIWLGFGYAPKLLIVFLLCFFPIVVAGVAGFKSVDPEIRDFARTTGASGWKMFLKIQLPQALPEIFTGLKVGAALSATAAVVAEFVAADRGLGYLLLRYNGNFETPMVFAVIVVLSLIGLAVYYLVELIERLVIPWHVSQRPTGVTGV